MQEEQTLLEFPCDFPIKVMGHAGVDLETTVLSIVQRHAPDFTAADMTQRDSRNGNYVAITATVRATSRAQLDAIYLEITACDQVVMAL